jgi:putative DNA primase/helicase
VNGGEWGYVLGFDDGDNTRREWVLPSRMLAGDGNEYRAALMGMGLIVGHSAAAKQALTRYILTREILARARTVDRLGWHGSKYVLQKVTIGETENERTIFQSDSNPESHFSARGSLEAWNENIGRFCVGNSRLLFAASSAFAGFLLRPSGLDSGGFHFVGDSSCGKTTALRVATSVLGAPAYLKRWRATDNGLESLAVQRCDALLVLDELAQLDARAAGEAAYLLANESGKVRANRAGATRPTLTWKTLIFSTGEIGLAAHMLAAGKIAKAGQELRMIDLSADAGAGFGAFETLHDEPDGAALSQRLQAACARTYGTPGRVFLEWVVGDVDTLAQRVKSRIDALATEWVPAGASGQVRRAAHRFALVAIGGEFAIQAGAVLWPPEQPAIAAKAMFDAWVNSRGGFDNSERYQMYKQCRAWFDSHGNARFESVARASDTHAPKIMNRAGYRSEAKPASDGSSETFNYLVNLDTFRNEIALGHTYKTLLTMLRDANLLTPDKGRPYDAKVRVTGTTDRFTCYRISSDVHSWEYGNE